MDSYAAIFADSHGSEHTTITNDGETLRMEIKSLIPHGNARTRLDSALEH